MQTFFNYRKEYRSSRPSQADAYTVLLVLANSRKDDTLDASISFPLLEITFRSLMKILSSHRYISALHKGTQIRMRRD